ncbi:radical SAM protein [Candidatus Woesearchaeota archaeon]|jgi:uncharacterized protein|nr:radical SAM protein [Candidatus Woesearchaeota archaeon]
MAILEFEDMSFEKFENQIRIVFLKNYECFIPIDELTKIGEFEIFPNKIELKNINENIAERKFNNLLTRAFQNLTNTITKKKTIYVHKQSKIPLKGTIYFGVVDRGSDMLDVRPLTGCNLNCVFCSVDEGISSKKTTDYVVEKDYLIQELKELIKFKQKQTEENIPYSVFINPLGEPLLYPKLVELIADIKKINGIKLISIMTNAELLTPKKADELINSGLNQLNISIHSLDPEKGKKIMGTNNYSTEKIKKTILYIREKYPLVKIILAPVFMKKSNEEDIKQIIKFGQDNGCDTGIQNFLRYKTGRNMLKTKEVKFIKFFEMLKQWETEFKIELIKNYKLTKTPQYDRAFKKGEIVKAEIIAPGRLPGEVLAKANNVLITVTDVKNNSGFLKVKIVRIKDGLYLGIHA